MALAPGVRLGPYAITAQIGVGGMGPRYNWPSLQQPKEGYGSLGRSAYWVEVACAAAPVLEQTWFAAAVLPRLRFNGTLGEQEALSLLAWGHH